MPTKAVKATKTVKPPMWILEQGLELVRRLQPESREFNYHLAIGGGVVNKGSSTKDLDIYAIPMDNDRATDFPGLEAWLETWLGDSELISGDGYGDSPTYRAKLKFMVGKQRIDVFVVRG